MSSVTEVLGQLGRRAQVAQATGVLIAVHRLSVQQAQHLIVQEALRREVGVAQMASLLMTDPASAREIAPLT